MAVPTPPDALEKVIKEFNPSEHIAGETETQNIGFLRTRKLVLLIPLEPIPIPFPSGMVLVGQRVRAQGTVISYAPEHTKALIEKRFPVKGDARGMSALSAYIISRIQVHGTTLSFSSAAETVQAEVEKNWGLVISLSILPDQPSKVYAKVTVPCNIRGWPRPVNITHEIWLIQVDPIRAASAGKLTQERLREWATEKLESITKDTLAVLSIDEVVEKFAQRKTYNSFEQERVEEKIKETVSELAIQQLGYQVDLYTATPELGIGGLSQGFDMEVCGEYRTSDFPDGTFTLITSFRVIINNLHKAIERKWLDASDPDRDVIEYAKADMTKQVRSAVQRAMNRVKTFDLCSELDGARESDAVESRIFEHIQSTMTETFESSISGISVQRPMQDKLSKFRADITRVCLGDIEFVYRQNTNSEIKFKASYSTGIKLDNALFMNFFQVCFSQIGDVDLVKQRIEKDLKGYAHQFLQTGNMMSKEAVLSLVASPPENLISLIFSKAIDSLNNHLGLNVRVGYLERTLPQKWMEDERLKMQMEGEIRHLKLTSLTTQSSALADISAPELVSERTKELEEAAASVGNTSDEFAKAMAHLAPVPKELLLGSGPAEAVSQKAQKHNTDIDKVIDAEIDEQLNELKGQKP